METLHTVLLGPYKYFLKTLMAKLNHQQKKKFQALIAAFDYSGFDVKVVGNICYHHLSFVGRDYKAWAQMAPFIITHFVDEVCGSACQRFETIVTVDSFESVP